MSSPLLIFKFKSEFLCQEKCLNVLMASYHQDFSASVTADGSQCFSSFRSDVRASGPSGWVNSDQVPLKLSVHQVLQHLRANLDIFSPLPSVLHPFPLLMVCHLPKVQRKKKKKVKGKSSMWMSPMMYFMEEIFFYLVSLLVFAPHLGFEEAPSLQAQMSFSPFHQNSWGHQNALFSVWPNVRCKNDLP